MAVAMAGVSSMNGCGYQESICSQGEDVVAQIGSPTGRTCVPDGQDPPAGFVRFPDGRVPQLVNDEWDRYWHNHSLDADGREIT